MKYQFINQENTILAKIDDDGLSRMSCSIENQEYLSWVANGNTADPYTPPPIDNQERISSLWNAAHLVEYNAISGSAIGLITMGVLQQKPKCLAVQSWIQALWAEYYKRKDSGFTDYDFTPFATCPHTVPELMQELSL